MVDFVAEAAIPGLICAYRFARDGTASQLGQHIAPADIEPNEGWIWLHFSLSDERAKTFIRDSGRLPAEARDTLLSRDEHVMINAGDRVVHGIFSDLQRELSGTTDMIGKLHFALADRVVITARRAALHSVDGVRQKLQDGMRLTAPAQLLEAIVNEFCLAVKGMAEKLADEIDEIEDLVLDPRRRDDRLRLIPVRRLVVRLHRQLLALNAIFHRLEKFRAEDLPEGLRETAADLSQHLVALDHEMVVLQDRARLLHEEMVSKVNSDTNSKLNLISIFTALFLPPTFVVGAFGMNTKDLPFGQTDLGFWYALGLCLVSSTATFVLLRRVNLVG